MPALAPQRLHHATVVVHDLRATARNYARILGISRWEVHDWTPDRLHDSQAFGYRAAFGYVTATGSNAEGVTFRLVQPTGGFSTFTEYLITRSEGIHSICATTAQAHPDLPIAQAATGQDGSRSVLFDTRRALGGYYVEVTTPEASPSAPDEVWDLSSDDQRPEGVGWLARIPKIGHFGVAVSSVMDKLPHYASLLGVERWSGVHFRRAPGAVEHSTFNGRPVDNAWFLAITDVADFGVELLQSTREPTDYGQTIARVGEGIHHVLVRGDLTDAEWPALQSWMESLRIGIVMSGRARYGAAEFFYFDTRTALGGFLLEVIVVHQLATPPPDARTLARFDLDFTTKG